MPSFQPKPIGIANVGNTCFLNVVLQALRICPPFLELFESDQTIQKVRSESKKLPFLSVFQTLFKEFSEAKAGGFIIPRTFVQTLLSVVRTCDDDWYIPRQQADAAECLQYLLDGVHDSLYRRVRVVVEGNAKTAEERQQVQALESWSAFFSKEYSPLVESFYGQTQACVTCQTCKTASYRYEPWLMMKVPIPGGDVAGSSVPTLADCLDAMFQPETIEDYACDVCKSKQTAIKTERISRLPAILILTLKRFTNQGAKIRGKIDWDLNSVCLKPWIAFTRSPFTGTRKVPEYSTFAVIEHQGSSQGGHYRMHSRIVDDDEEWIEYDDCSVRKARAAEIVTPDSYILFLHPNTQTPKEPLRP